jgi:hypothetical protein
MGTFNTVKLKNYSDIFEEYDAAAAITPGMLIELDTAGKVKAHATADGDVTPPMFAIEDFMQGKGIDDNYAADDKVQVWIPGRGDQVYAILANDEVISIGEKLVSNGAGMLKAHTLETVASAEDQAANSIYSAPIVAVALEAMDLSGSSDAGSAGESSVGTLGFNKRIKVRIV